MDTPILDMLKRYKSKNRISFCMPGHKNGSGLVSDFSSFSLDVTELHDTDNLQNSQNAIKKSLNKAKDFYKTKATFYLTNGSTSGIFAMIASSLKPHDKLLVSRNCHSSVINAMTLLDIEPIYINQPILNDFSVSGGIDCDLAEVLIKEHSPKAMIITSPNYYGICCDVKKIASVCHKYNIPLLVDSAHGAHFHGNCDIFPVNSISNGADLVVESAHKTLNSVNQTALLHYNSDIISQDKVKSAVSMFLTSSPSYLLCASIDFAISDLMENGYNSWKKVYDKVLNFKNSISEYYKIIDRNVIGKDFVFDVDETRLTINFSDYNITGFRVSEILRKEYNIDIEMADLHNIVLIPTVSNSDSDFDILENALIKISKTMKKKSLKDLKISLPDLIQGISPTKAFHSSTKLIDLKSSQNKISAKTITSYPPAVPIITSGGVITKETILALLTLSESGAEISGLYDDKILITE